MADGPNSDYLVIDKQGNQHLRVKRNGKPDHNLMGAAWAALHEGFRGNKYEGPDKSEALAKLKRLYASEKMELPTAQMEGEGEVISHLVWKFAGKFPNDVPLNDGISLDEIKQLDEDPVFVTLPLMQIGMKARDGLLYSKELVGRVYDHLKAQGYIANMGHVPINERNTSFPMPKALWVGAQMDPEGMLWGKAYLTDPNFKTLVKQMKATNAEIATSIYGTHDMSQAKFNKDGTYEINAPSFKLESIDFAPPARAALQFERGAPVLTSHMETEEMTKEELLAQMTIEDVPTELAEAIIAQFKASQDTEATLSQMRTELDETKKENERLTAVVAEAAKNAVVSQFDAKLNATVEADTEEGALKAMIRDRVVSQLTAETSEEDMDKLIEGVTSSPLYMNLAKIVVSQLSGGHVISQGGETPKKTAGEIAEENAKKILARQGITF